MPQKLNYVCIGAGGIARKKHLNTYSRLSSVSVQAICDTNLKAAEALANEFGIKKIYMDYKEMFLSEKPDIASICTPNFLHADIACEALNMGINIHCEKPLALNHIEAQRIVEAEKKSGKSVLLGMNKRYSGQSILISKLAAEGFFGDIYHARCGWIRNSGIPGIGKWFTEQRFSGGGVLIDLGVHYLDLVFSFMDYPEPSAVTGSVYSVFGGNEGRVRRGYKSEPSGFFNVEDMAVGMIRLKNKGTVDFEFSWASNIEKEIEFVELAGTKGGMCMENGTLKLFRQEGGSCLCMIPDISTVPEDIDESSHFVDCILTGKKPRTTAEQGLNILKLVDGIYESALLGNEIILS